MNSSDAGGGSDNKITSNTTTTTIKNFPIDLAQKIAMVKPNDGKTTNVQQGQQTFRTIGQQPMRMITVPGTGQGSGTAQIIQTHIMPQTMLKQVDGSTRAQITAMPARSLNQPTSITVSRAPTQTTFGPRGPNVTNANIRGTLATPIRTPTPPSSLANIGSAFVRGTMPIKTQTTGTVLSSPGSTQTWLGNAVQVQVPTQIIRATNMNTQSPRSRIITQTAVVPTSSVNISSNVQNSGLSAVVSQNNQIVSSQNPGQTQTYVATLATVLPPRQQPSATLVYSNPQQHYSTGTGGQRLAVAASIGQRQVRPIQLTQARLPAASMGLRGTTANISIRTPSVPVLAPTNVLTSIPSSVHGRSGGTVTTANIPAARIIQVQQQPGGGMTVGQPGSTAQVINAGRLTGNVMTLHPVIVNASGATGNRLATSISTKVQPSLTITHVKSAMSQNAQQSGGTITVVSQSQAQNQQNTATVSAGGQHTIGTQPQIAQIVNVNQQGSIQVNQSGHQIVTVSQQQILSGAAGNQNQHGIATVVPVAINPRSTNVVTGTITSIGNNRNVVPVSSGTTILPIAKVLPQQQTQQIEQSSGGGSNQAQGQQVLIHARSPSANVVSSSNNTSTNVLTSSGPFLPPSHSTFYYEHSTNSSTGNPVLTLTTSSVNAASAGGAGNQIHSSNLPPNLMTSVPYHAHAPSGGSFAVVPSTNSRGISQIHGLVPASNQGGGGSGGGSGGGHQTGQLQAVRFTPQLLVDSSPSHQAAHQIITMSQQAAAAAAVQQQQQQQQSNSNMGNISVQQNQQQSQQQQQQQQAQQTQHMLIPVTAKLAPSPRPSILKKREAAEMMTSNSGPTLKAAKNLGPTLISMSSESGSGSGSICINMGGGGHQTTKDMKRERNMSPQSRPGSSDGSTTVSATSSPGLDQQEQEEMAVLNMRHDNNMQFKPVEAHYPSVHQTGEQSEVINSVPERVTALSRSSMQHQMSTGSSSNNDNIDITPRKKPRKQQMVDNLDPHVQYVNDHHHHHHHHHEVNSADHNSTSSNSTNHAVNVSGLSGNSGGTKPMNINHSITNNKENSHSVDMTIKKPRTSLLETYKQTWKPANNHFQRYTDVKPREERRPNVMDLANQAHVLQKVNGWKIYHLSSQMEDLCELESQVHSKLSNMLQFMEAHETCPDIERVNDLIKGNMQRSKVIIDGVNDAKSQIMKIFDHKAHVSDIIHRCASKRNFKKREKM